MSIPQSLTGLTNYYQAHLHPVADSTLNVLSLSLDSLSISQPFAFAKIDTEGHEYFVTEGMQRLLSVHWPTLIVETDSKAVIGSILACGYGAERLQNSPNVLFNPN